MNWTTLYITGRPDFRHDVYKKIEQANIPVMPGTLENTIVGVTCALFWIDDNTTLRMIKEAIGSKLVLKYRLRFYESLNAIPLYSNGTAPSTLTEEDIALINSMRKKTLHAY